MHLINVWCFMCLTGPRPRKIGDWEDIFVTHYIIIIKSDVSTVSIDMIVFTILPWLWVRDVPSHPASCFISIRESWISDAITVQFVMYADYWMHCGLKVGFVRLHITLSYLLLPSCRLIRKHWTCKMCIKHILSKIDSILSIIFQAIYQALCYG